MSGLRRIALAGVAVLAAASTAGALRRTPQVKAIEAANGVSGSGEALQLSSISASEIEALVARSPFDPARARYQRTVAAAPPPATVTLQGVFTISGERRATLQINGATETVGVGAETAAGTIVEINASSVVLQLDGARREVTLFGR